MITPNFLSDQFVDQNIFNAAMAEILTSTREVSANSVFIIPGVINPASLLFTTNGTLQVSVTTPNTGVNAFKCAFQTGAITAGFGTTAGITTSSYTADFTTLVPVAGSVVAYIVAQYTQVSEDASTILGPPPGHPDYSSNFVPYIGYTQLQDSLNIFTTTTAPDNLTTIELARTTLVAGQTQVNSVDTSHQVLARVNANTTLAGDVTGPVGSNIISNLQGKPVAAGSPSPNNALVWNGAAWAPVAMPTTLPPSGPAGGDLVGTYPNPQVQKSTTSLFTANAISSLGTILAASNINSGGNIAATGYLSGADASAGNQAIMLDQLGSITSIGPINPTVAGDIYHQSFKLPILMGGVLKYIIVNFGFYSFYNLSQTQVKNTFFHVTYATPFTQGALFASSNWATNDFSTTGSGAFSGTYLAVETPQLNSPTQPLNGTDLYIDADYPGGVGTTYIAGAHGQAGLGLLGFWWIIAGI